MSVYLFSSSETCKYLILGLLNDVISMAYVAINARMIT
jgi:hypothetical protein